MVDSGTSFDDDRLRAARNFAHTMIVVDDEAGDVQSSRVAVEKQAQVVMPDRGDAMPPDNGSDAHRGTRPSHPLDQKALIESALALGLVCAVVRPDEDQDVATQVAKAAERADIVSLDWKMSDDGEKAISIINRIIRDDDGMYLLTTFETEGPR